MIHQTPAHTDHQKDETHYHPNPKFILHISSSKVAPEFKTRKSSLGSPKYIALAEGCPEVQVLPNHLAPSIVSVSPLVRMSTDWTFHSVIF
jgi:hypothetical protein